MEVALQPGIYVVAVSGGVDSVALLHALQALPGVRLTVAHYDHGIRADSAEDMRHVRQLARDYKLPFVTAKGELGAGASEAVARDKRYAFLHQVRRASGASAVITAHHQDDVLETAILNILRGTGRRGLTSLRSTDIVKRPLLHVSKSDIVRYARDNQLVWREDSTNADDTYKRNYVRHRILPRFGADDRKQFHDILVDVRQTNLKTDQMIATLLAAITENRMLKRHEFIILPHAVSREIMAAWLRGWGLTEIDSTLLERLVHAGKTFKPGKRVNVSSDWVVSIKPQHLALEHFER